MPLIAGVAPKAGAGCCGAEAAGSLLAPNVNAAPPPGAVDVDPVPNMFGCDVIQNRDLATPLPVLEADTGVFWSNIRLEDLMLLRTGRLLAPNIGAELADGAPNWKVLLLTVALVVANGLAVESFFNAPKSIVGADGTTECLNVSALPFSNVCDPDTKEGVDIFKGVCDAEAADGMAVLNSDPCPSGDTTV